MAISDQPTIESMRPTRRSEKWIVVFLSLWLVGVCSAFWQVGKYKSTPGAVGSMPVRWPAATSLPRDPTRSQLVMFLHPKCVCSRASLAELSQLLMRADGRCAVDIVFLIPKGASADWRKGDVWDTARAIPNASVTADDGGIEARRFGAETSGHVDVFDASGKLQYGGGITVWRGHQGDNPGQQRAWDAVMQGQAVRQDGPVFGCAFEPPGERGR
jgi:hypothetical protein